MIDREKMRKEWEKGSVKRQNNHKKGSEKSRV